MAGFQTIKMCIVVVKIERAVTQYESLQKSKSSTSLKEIDKRAKFSSSIVKLFDIATPNLEDLLNESRLLGNDDSCSRYKKDEGYTRKTEDLSFLRDQRGERRMIMGTRDATYEERVIANKLRKAQANISNSSNDQISFVSF